MPDFGSSLPEVAVRSALVYLTLVVALRLTGKRDVGQLSIPDLVVLLVVSNGVQNAMIGGNQTFLGGVAAIIGILGTSRVVQIASRRSFRIRRLVQGQPRILYAKGRFNRQVLDEEEITADELAAAFRAHGVMNRRDVRMAVLEVDGSISVISNDEGAQGSRRARRAGRMTRPQGDSGPS
ncbi:MAG: DUF421 domain-containing protein [Candidatus Limnocylindrales bacterium]